MRSGTGRDRRGGRALTISLGRLNWGMRMEVPWALTQWAWRHYKMDIAPAWICEAEKSLCSRLQNLTMMWSFTRCVLALRRGIEAPWWKFRFATRPWKLQSSAEMVHPLQMVTSRSRSWTIRGKSAERELWDNISLPSIPCGDTDRDCLPLDWKPTKSLRATDRFWSRGYL